MKERRRGGEDLPILRSESATVYLVGVPKTRVSETSRSEKALESVKNQGLTHMVAWGGIEPPTQGFSFPTYYYLSLLIDVDLIHINQ